MATRPGSTPPCENTSSATSAEGFLRDAGGHLAGPISPGRPHTVSAACGSRIGEAAHHEAWTALAPRLTTMALDMIG